jgi:hypothetical protein
VRSDADGMSTLPADEVVRDVATVQRLVAAANEDRQRILKMTSSRGGTE